MIDFLWNLLLFLIPRFTTEEVGLRVNMDGYYEVLGWRRYLTEEELAEVDCYAKLKCFTWFGLCFGELEDLGG